MIFGIHVVSAAVNVFSSLRHKLTALNWLMHSAAHGYTFLTAFCIKPSISLLSHYLHTPQFTTFPVTFLVYTFGLI